jgi:hypothetical protein
VRHRWLGPLFVVLLCLMLALLFLHMVHDAEHSAATELGEFCLGLVVMFSLVIVIRLRWRVVLPLLFPRSGRAPPAFSVLAPPTHLAALSSPSPLRL